MEQYCPTFLEELKGLSAGTNIKLDKLLILQNRLYSLFEGQCTVTLSTGPATKNNGTFLTFNIDGGFNGIKEIILSYIFHVVLTLRFWVVRVNTDEYKYTFWGIPILYELPFFNEEGLGWGSPGTVVTKDKNRTIDKVLAWQLCYLKGLQ